jgi:hypothetical protein
MDDPMPHAGEGSGTNVFFEPLDHHVGGRPEIRGVDGPGLGRFSVRACYGRLRVRQADPFDPAREEALGGAARRRRSVKKCELEAR